MINCVLLLFSSLHEYSDRGECLLGTYMKEDSPAGFEHAGVYVQSALGDRLHALKRHDRWGEVHLAEDGVVQSGCERVASSSSGLPPTSGAFLRTAGSAPPSAYAVQSLDASSPLEKAFSQPVEFPNVSHAASLFGGLQTHSGRQGMREGSGQVADVAAIMQSEKPTKKPSLAAGVTRIHKGFDISEGVARAATVDRQSPAHGMITVSSLSAGLADAAALESGEGPLHTYFLEDTCAGLLSSHSSESRDLGRNSDECSRSDAKDDLLNSDLKLSGGLSSHDLDLHGEDVEEDFLSEQLAQLPSEEGAESHCRDEGRYSFASDDGRMARTADDAYSNIISVPAQYVGDDNESIPNIAR